MSIDVLVESVSPLRHLATASPLRRSVPTQMAPLLLLVIPLRLRLRDRRTPRHAEAAVARTDHRVARVAVRRPAMRSIGIVSAATVQAGRAAIRILWIGRRIWWIVRIQILTTLPNIPVHVVQAQAFGFFSRTGCVFF